MPEGVDKKVDAAYVRNAENSILSHIEQLRSNPSNAASLVASIQALLSTEGISPGIIAAAQQALEEARERTKATAQAGEFIVPPEALTDKQKKLVADFYTTFEELKEGVKHYQETLADIKQKDLEIERLRQVIEADPFTIAAQEARTRQSELILDMISLSSTLSNHGELCENKLKECHHRRQNIEEDATINPELKEQLVQQARRDVEQVEQELRNAKQQGFIYDQKLVSHLETALLETVAAKRCSTKEDYVDIMVAGLPPEDKVQIRDFIETVKNMSAEMRMEEYEEFTNRFVGERVGEVKAQEVVDRGMEEEDIFDSIIEDAPDKKLSFAESVKQQREQKDQSPTR